MDHLQRCITSADSAGRRLGSMTQADRIAGLVRLIGIVIALFVLGSLLTGSTFFTMSWAGQHVLRDLRVDVFERLHQLSLSYYAENEAGDLMSRITNDTSAIEQAISFALVNVFSGILLLVWVAYNMLTTSLAFAVLSLAVAPLMFLATLYFSDAGAQGLPQEPQRDRQRQCRVAGKHCGRARSAGLQPRR